MKTSIEIIGIKEVTELYGFSRKEATRLLNTKGCPVLPRESGMPYRVVKDEFETWLRTRRA
jgi:predicted DNA-binding transcriptional regulator AlpA